MPIIFILIYLRSLWLKDSMDTDEIKKELDEVFGVEKQASVKSDDNVDVKGKEEIGQSKEGESNEEAQDDSEDEHKTPAEHVIEQKPGQSIFNY